MRLIELRINSMDHVCASLTARDVIHDGGL